MINAPTSWYIRKKMKLEAKLIDKSLVTSFRLAEQIWLWATHT